MLTDGKALEDLVEVRLTFEPLVVLLAAERAFLAMQSHLKDMATLLET